MKASATAVAMHFAIGVVKGLPQAGAVLRASVPNCPRVWASLATDTEIDIGQGGGDLGDR